MVMMRVILQISFPIHQGPSDHIHYLVGGMVPSQKGFQDHPQACMRTPRHFLFFSRVTPSGAIKYATSARVGVPPPPAMTWCLLEQAFSTFLVAEVC